MRVLLQSLYKKLEQHPSFEIVGRVVASKGVLFEIVLPRASIGDLVLFKTKKGMQEFGEVVAISGKKCFAMPYGTLDGANSETLVYLKENIQTLKVSPHCLGRVVDFLGNPLDSVEELGPIEGPFFSLPLKGVVHNPLERALVNKPVDLGVKAINAFLTIGEGQRISIMAASGVGKSMLLSMMAKNSDADVNVLALIGERGREVSEFIYNDLGPEGLKKSVVIVATSDTSALVRLKAAYTASTIAEYFSSQGKSVVLMMDSLTRFAHAHREISSSTGETPGPKGHAASLFAILPKLLERCGSFKNKGPITGLYTVLAEGNDFEDPVVDAVRAITDGHLVLTRDLAEKNHYPAIDILKSISRVMNQVVSQNHKVVVGYLRTLYAEYLQNEDLLSIGAYVTGANPKVDKFLKIREDFFQFLRQFDEDRSQTSLEAVYTQVIELARKAEDIKEEKENGP